MYNHLKELENQSIFIFREAYRKFENLAMLYSIGKDSTVMIHLAQVVEKHDFHGLFLGIRRDEEGSRAKSGFFPLGTRTLPEATRISRRSCGISSIPILLPAPICASIRSFTGPN